MKYAKTISPSFVANFRDAEVPWGPVGYVTYKRTYARRVDEGLTEEWFQTLERCCNGLLQIGGAFTQDEIQSLYGLCFNLKCNFSGRALWQLGTPTVERLGGDSLQNCWVTAVNKLDAFTFAFNELMLGGGVGFNITPEFVYELPPVKYGVRMERVESFDCDFLVPDNREGWVELLDRVLRAFFHTGRDVRYNTFGVRDKGVPINGFGGVASGAEELVRGLGLIAKILQSAVGRKLRPVECLDIMNIIGMIVVAGNVRRSAQIACGDPRDLEFLNAKNWSRFKVPPWRQFSNNSVITPSIHTLPSEFWDPYEGQGECYGLVNLDLCRTHGRLADGANYRPDPGIIAPNPCVAADTWVHTSQGPRQVVDLVGKPFRAAVNDWTYQSTDAGFFATGVKPLFLVETLEGYSFKATADHEIKTVRVTRDARYVKWAPLKHLVPGHKISLHNHRGLRWDGKGSWREGWVLGSLLGDGTFTDDDAKLKFWGETGPAMEEFASKALTQTIGTLEVCRLKSRRLKTHAESFGVNRTKALTSEVEQTSYEFHRGFLSGWFDADGSVQGNREKGVSVRLASSILGNLYAAQRMLARLGIVSTVYPNRRDAGPRLMPDGQGGTQYYECAADHELVIANDNLFIFDQVVDFVDPLKAEKLDQLLGGYTRRPNRERFTATVKSVTLVGEEQVFDCTIPGPSEFDGNAVNLHNCGEIPEEDGEACNLFELYLPRLEDINEFVEAARFGYMSTKTISQLSLIHDKSNEVVRRNHRLGIGVTGYCASGSFYKNHSVFDAVYQSLEDFDREYSREIRSGESIKLTTVKPSGTSSLLPGVPPGVHPDYAPFYIRRITFASNNPLVDMARDHGYTVEPKVNIDGTLDFGSMMVDFPVKARDGAITEKDVTATDQLENQLFLQTHWADNSVSMSCYFRPDELPGIQDWLGEHYTGHVKTASFFRHSGHGFRQAPYEEITEQQYLALKAGTRPITRIADCSELTDTGSLECSSGGCPTK